MIRFREILLGYHKKSAQRWCQRFLAQVVQWFRGAILGTVKEVKRLDWRIILGAPSFCGAFWGGEIMALGITIEMEQNSFGI